MNDESDMDSMGKCDSHKLSFRILFCFNGTITTHSDLTSMLSTIQQRIYYYLFIKFLNCFSTQCFHGDVQLKTVKKQ